MPFLTEDLWQRLPWHPEMYRPESIMIAKHPEVYPALRSDEVEADMEAVKSIVAKTRNMRSGAFPCTWPSFTLPRD